MSLLIKLGAALFVTVILLAATLFVVPQTQQVLVLQFGEIKRVIREPGLHAKMPFIQNVMFFDKRILPYQAQPQEFITSIEERVLIDAFVRYRIIDPVQFYQAVRNEENFNSRLDKILQQEMRSVLEKYSLADLLSLQRVEVMDKIQSNLKSKVAAGAVVTSTDGKAQRRALGFGVEIVDVRIMRAELPDKILQSTYERMQADFTKEAQRYRAEGNETAITIQSSAERERTEIIAEARRKSETIRGEGDAEAAKISSAAYGRDPNFYKFYRSMQAYRRTLGTNDTTMVLTPDGEFLDELNP